MDATVSADPTLDELRLELAPRIAAAAAFDGWSARAVDAAADETGTDHALAQYAFNGGAMAMIDAWTRSVDVAMAQALPASDLAVMKIRERIRTLVLFRLDAIDGLEEALRRAMAIMALPWNAPAGLRIGWRSADAMWRLAGDTATDLNHYTKRATLGAIYTATLAAFIDDQTFDKSETRAFLDRRIDGLMRFEKAKAQLLRPGANRFSPVRLLGRLRYPAR